MGALGVAVMGAPLWGDDNVMQYLATLSPMLLNKFNEPSGNLQNYGSEGALAVGTVSGCTYAQAGQLGASEAYLFDGADDYVSIANAVIPNVKALTTQRWCWLINASSLGESDFGTIAAWGAGTPTGQLFLRFNVGNSLVAYIDTDGTDPVAVTNDNQVDFLATWALLFLDYDNADALGLGRRIRLFRATAASATTLLTLFTNTAGTGTIVAHSNALLWGNRSGTDTSFAGLMDMAFVGAGLWTPATLPTDLTVMNRIRSLVFKVP